MSADAKRVPIIESMAGVEAGAALDSLAARRLTTMMPEEAAQTLAEVVARAPSEAREVKVVAALCRAIVWGPPDLPPERRREIRVAAVSLGLAPVIALFTEATPARTLESDPAARRADPQVGTLTLGHRKFSARTETNPQRLARLAFDTDPTVIRNLLSNPRLTESLVLRIASRRPTSEEVLAEVAHAPRWNTRVEVRRALAMNPYSPSTVACSLLPQFHSRDLREVAGSAVVHPAVSDAAVALLRARGESGW